MRSGDINKSLIEGYLRMLENLSPGSKLDLISKLSSSIKTDIAGNHSVSINLSAHGNLKNRPNRSLPKSAIAAPSLVKSRSFEAISH
jgi:hypothetical protein